MLSFWLIIVFPWVLDVASQSRVLETAFGALLWGVAVVLAAVLPRTRDSGLRQKLSTVLWALSSTWLLFWFLSLIQHSEHQVPLIHPDYLHWLNFSHSGLLAAGAGMVFSLWMGASLWILQDRALRKSSWERRHNLKGNLPSLESLARFCQWAVLFAFTSWFLGLILAFVAAHLQWQRWLSDPKVFASSVLAGLLLLCVQLRMTLSPSTRWLYRAYWVICTFFLVFFVRLMLPGVASMHEPMRWFVR